MQLLPIIKLSLWPPDAPLVNSWKRMRAALQSATGCMVEPQLLVTFRARGAKRFLTSVRIRF